MSTQTPELRYTRPHEGVVVLPAADLGAAARYKRALELAIEIEHLLEADAPPSSRLAYSARIVQAMNRSLIDQLAEIVRDGAA